VSRKDFNSKKQGFVVALAWPETTCKQAGAWYDHLMIMMGFNHDNFYKAGHAAAVLVAPDGQCHYFDFGRYHSPYGYGRVRSADTDHELLIQTKASISSDGKRIENFSEILDELAHREACHGTGPLFGGYAAANFDKALAGALSLQNRGVIPYGPFLLNGTNCSRFVYSVILSALPLSIKKLRFAVAIPLTPTTLTNVKSLGNVIVRTPEKLPVNGFVKYEPVKNWLKSVRPSPLGEKPSMIPLQAKWISGEGAGSWFHIEKDGDNYLITRYSPEGIIEGKSIFESATSEILDIDKSYHLEYLSHCREINISQDGVLINLVRKKIIH
jgi:hypothetical protein